MPTSNGYQIMYVPNILKQDFPWPSFENSVFSGS